MQAPASGLPPPVVVTSLDPYSSLASAMPTSSRLFRPFSRFMRYYNANFERRPVPTLMITNGVLNSIADAVVSSWRAYESGI